MIKCIISGNVSTDLVLSNREWTNKETGEIIKTSVCNFNVAANDGYGENKTTTFFRVSAWRGLGETCAKYLKKGRGVLVVGPVKQNNYIDKNGNVRTAMEIRAEEIQFLGGGKTETEPSEPVEAEAPVKPAPGRLVVEDVPY